MSSFPTDPATGVSRDPGSGFVVVHVLLTGL
jgi:hypothetical protein